MNREGTPGVPRNQSPGEISGLILEPTDRELSLFYPLAIPLVAMIALFLLSPATLPWALPTMVLTGILTFLATRDLKAAATAAGIAPLVLAPASGPATLILLALLIPATLFGTSLLLLPAAAAILLPTPLGGFLLAYTIALLVSWPHAERPGQALLFGLPPNQFLDRLALGPALLLTIVAILLTPPAWAAPAGLVAGTVARIVTRHPANARIGSAMTRVAAGLSIAPAGFLFLLAALGRLPPASETRMIVLTWGLVGIGLLILLAGFGIQLLMRSTGPWAAIALSAILTATLLAIGTTFLLGSTLGALPVGTGWALLAPWAAVGATRLALGYPKRPLIVWGGITLAVAVTYGIHAV